MPVYGNTFELFACSTIGADERDFMATSPQHGFPLPRPKPSDPFSSSVTRLLCLENQELSSAMISIATGQTNTTGGGVGVASNNVLASLLRLLEAQKLLLPVLKREFQRDPLELLTRHEGRVHDLISRYLELSSQTYLRRIFNPIISNLMQDVNYYEIPEATGAAKYPLTTSKVLSAIFVSQTFIPTILRKVVRELVVDSLPSLLPSPAMPVVAKILFVRLFAAALRRPADYQLCDAPLSVQTQYVLHKVANRLEKMSKMMTDTSAFNNSNNNANNNTKTNPANGNAIANDTLRNNFLLMTQFISDFLNTPSSFVPVKEPRLEVSRVDYAILFCFLEKNSEKISTWLGVNVASEDRATFLKRKLRDELKVLRYAASQQSFFLAGEYERLAMEVPLYLSKQRPGDSPIEIVHAAVCQIIQIFKENCPAGSNEVSQERWEEMCAKKALQPISTSLRDLREISLSSLSETERTVFFLNLFNALMVQSLLKQGIPDQASRSLWMRSTRCCLDEHNYTLTDIELILLTPSLRFEKEATASPKEHIRKWLSAKPDMRLNFAMARGVRLNSLLRVYTPENFSRELDAVSNAFLESTINIDPIRKEICLPPLFEQRQSDFGRSVSALLEWLQPHLLSSRLRTAAELLYKDVANVKVLFDFDTRSNSFYYRFE